MAQRGQARGDDTRAFCARLSDGESGWSTAGTKPKRPPRQSVPLANFLGDAAPRQEVKILKKDGSMRGNANVWLNRPTQPKLHSEADFPSLNGATNSSDERRHENTTNDEPPVSIPPRANNHHASREAAEIKVNEPRNAAKVTPMAEKKFKQQRPPRTPANPDRITMATAKIAPDAHAEPDETEEKKKAKRRRNRKKKTIEQPTSQSLQIWNEAKFEKFKTATLGSANSPTGRPGRAIVPDAFEESGWPSLGAGDDEDLPAVSSSKDAEKTDGLKDDDQWEDITLPWIQYASGETTGISGSLMSWSSVVKSAVVKQDSKKLASRQASVVQVPPQEGEQKKKRIRKRKKGTTGEGSATQPLPTKQPTPVAPTASKRQEPIQLDLTAVIQKAKSKKSEKEKASTKAGVKGGRAVANTLDSTAPKVRRGKEREKPKKKKLSKLKKLIIAERARRAALRKNLQEIDWTGAEVTILEPGQETPDEALGKTEEVKHQREEAMKSLSETCRQAGSYVFKRNFRNYCCNFVTKEISELAIKLIRELMRFQDRLHQRDPVKAKIKRRLVFGLRECVKHGGLKKLKAVLIAPDLEEVEAPGGLNDVISKIKGLSEEYAFPVIACLQRRKFGYVCLKKAPVSAVGILDYSGAEEFYKPLLVAFENEKNRLIVRLEEVQRDILSGTAQDQPVEAEAEEGNVEEVEE